MIAFPNCKINLGLHILQKRTDGFHDIETVFYPFPLTDALEIIQSTEPHSTLDTSGITIDALAEDNICFKAYALLKKDFPQLPAVKMHLHKTIPAGAGLGGGSADGAFALQMLNKKFSLGLPQETLINYALQLGSDCPFFVLNRPCVAGGRGELLEPIALDLTAYSIVLVNPGIHVNTGRAFSQVQLNPKPASLKSVITRPVSEWRSALINDFEAPVFKEYPEIREIKESFYKKGALYASMTGTGSTVYALFEKERLPSFNFPDHYFISVQ